MSSKEERARQYYEQCQEAYSKFLTIPHAKSILSMNGKDIDMPSNFYDSYNVPAELLRREVRDDAESESNRIDFEYKLLEMMHDKTSFDFETLKKKKGTKDKRRQKLYKIYFEVYYYQPKSSKPLFKRQITIGGITYKWCNRKTLDRHIKLLESREDAGEGLYVRRRNERLLLRKDDMINSHNLRSIVARVRALNEIEAVNVVSSKMDDYIACVNVLQNRGRQSVTMFSSQPKTKHKTAIVSVGVFLVQTSSEPVDILIENSRQALPTQDLTITDQRIKMSQLITLLRAFDDRSPAAIRLKSITRELAQAIDTDNPNLRQLGYWRCLEIVTAKSNNDTRKEDDIVKIFKNYIPETKHWHQMGDIIKNTRNNYVHRGVSTSGEELNEYYLNWSQQYAEAALKIAFYLYKHRAIWKTDDDIDTFFDLYAKTDNELVLAGNLLRARKSSKR